MDKSGKTYNSQEYSRLDSFIKEQQAEMEKIDLEKSVQTKKIVQYAMILTGIVVSLYVFSRLIKKNQ